VTEIGEEDIPLEPKKSSDGKPIIAEEIVEGHITWNSLKLLMESLGGGVPYLVLRHFCPQIDEWSITFQTFLG
jgi:hypothetical protein